MLSLSLCGYIIFTSHYVTINSVESNHIDILAVEFTSHYVTINSIEVPINLDIQLKFTSHYVTINSGFVIV